MSFTKELIKDIGLQREVEKAYPYAVVGGSWWGSFNSPVNVNAYYTALLHIVPAHHQLKVLYLRVWTQESGGAKFQIFQTNPTAAGATGTVEAFPVVGNVPAGARDYPMLEDAGCEVLRGGLETPVHVLEGSIEFRIMGPTALPATGEKYGITFWGVQKNSEPTRPVST